MMAKPKITIEFTYRGWQVGINSDPNVSEEDEAKGDYFTVWESFTGQCVTVGPCESFEDAVRTAQWSIDRHIAGEVKAYAKLFYKKGV